MKQFNFIKYTSLAGLCIVLLGACSKMEDPVAPFIVGGEKIYATRVDSLKVLAGRNKVNVTWELSPNRTATQAIITWDNNTKTKTVEINPTAKKFETILDNLPESSYLFNVYTIDKLGNKSVPLVVTGSAYGDLYQGSLFNRQVPSAYSTLENEFFIVNWSISQGDVGIRLSYTDINNTAKVENVLNTQSTISFNNLKLGSSMDFQTLYKPEPTAFEMFTVAEKKTIAVNPWSGKYNAVGVRINYDAAGNKAGDPVAIGNEKVFVKKAGTLNVYESTTVANLAPAATNKLVLTRNSDNTVEVSGFVGAASIKNHRLLPKSRYEPATGIFYLNYEYTNADGTSRLMEEKLLPK
ncbi:DUF4998 domain-containing protein [Pedobacter sp. GSP4]|uniref:DUF4998 domain-containing protein n=1 Tax=Pedobacter sp. GSP4 TaxID=3453716 RepID=UPI003EF03AB7